MTQTPHRDAGTSSVPGGEMAARVAPLWSREKVRSELGFNDAALWAAVAAGDVLGLETSDGALVFPVAQFERVAGQARVCPGVRAMLRELQGDERWSVALVLAASAPELGDVSPYDAVKSGADSRDLANFARVVHSYWR
jgi:hypothetical protein